MGPMCNLRAFCRAAFTLGVSILIAASAFGSPVTFGFKGVVTSVTGPLDSSVQVGTPFAGSYTFESTTPDTSSIAEFGVYDNALAQYGYTAVTLGNYCFTPNPTAPDLRILIHNAATFDAYEVYGRSMTTNTTGMTCTWAIWVNLFDNTASVFQTDKLPLVPPDISKFDYNQGNVFGALNGQRYTIDVRVTDLYAVPVPGAAVAGVSLLGLLMSARVFRKFCESAR